MSNEDNKIFQLGEQSIEIPEGVQLKELSKEEDIKASMGKFFTPLEEKPGVDIDIIKEKDSSTFIMARYHKVNGPSILKPVTDIYVAVAKEYGIESTHLIIKIDRIMNAREFREDMVEQLKGTYAILSSIRNYVDLKNMKITVFAGGGLPLDNPFVKGALDSFTKNGIDFRFLTNTDPGDITGIAAVRMPNGVSLPPQFAGAKEVKLLNNLSLIYGNTEFVLSLCNAYTESLDLPDQF